GRKPEKKRPPEAGDAAPQLVALVEKVLATQRDLTSIEPRVDRSVDRHVVGEFCVVVDPRSRVLGAEPRARRRIETAREPRLRAMRGEEVERVRAKNLRRCMRVIVSGAHGEKGDRRRLDADVETEDVDVADVRELGAGVVQANEARSVAEKSAQVS